MKQFQRRLLRLVFHLLYNQLAWTYDAVSWLVSKGHWQRWTHAAIPRLQGQRVLELGPGPGHLQNTMYEAGYSPWGIDLSAPMIRTARKNLRASKTPLHLCRGRAQQLPLASESFHCVVATFPAGFIFEPATIEEVERVLVRGGRFIIVDNGRLTGGDLHSRFMAWLFYVLGLAGRDDCEPEAVTVEVAAQESTRFDVRYEEDQVGESRIGVWIATKRK